MPYCSQCGNSVKSADIFCASCGRRQPSSGASQSGFSQAGSSQTGSSQTWTTSDISWGGVTPRTASLLCYIPVVGWLAAIVVLASGRFRTDTTVRFHAFQGLYLFVAWLLVDWVVQPFFGLGMPPFWGFHHLVPGLLKLVIFIAWVFMIVKVAQDPVIYKLPIVGELAEKSVFEQR